MKIDPEIKLDFSDVLMRPKRSELGSRKEVSLERTFKFKHSPLTWTGIPIMVSNMDTTGTVEMAIELQKYKIITCLHKHYNSSNIPYGSLDKNYFAISTGIGGADLERLDVIMADINPNFICIDVANGYSAKLLHTCQVIRKKYPDKIIIAGNVVTREMVEELIINGGVDIVKCGIGSGSVCTTRIQTGVGYPQLSAVMECSDSAHGANGQIISDGGIQVPGDIGKAFGAGADFVMCGSIFAGHTESGGDVIIEEGVEYKVFYGMSSSNAMNKYSGGVAKYRSAEGKCVKLKHRGPIETTIDNILGGLRSTMTYIGAKKMKHIGKCASFIRVNNQVNSLYK
tara:strand:- start:5568 stop:6590 length:1023 start_codon:yes stop_codon:yes gene_type:complete